jgi:predicted GH43/DUF377 family glycosyl hydrolase
MNHIKLHRSALILSPESSRVIIRPFIPGGKKHIERIVKSVLALTEKDAALKLKVIEHEFGNRHLKIRVLLMKNYTRATSLIDPIEKISNTKKILIGALFSGEYSLESAALFNPSIVPHPDQKNVPKGGLRFIMSLRATGEGHISSIEFRVGIISPSGAISFDPISRYVSEPEVLPNPNFLKQSFMLKLHEMELDNDCSAKVMSRVQDSFTLSELNESIGTVRHHGDKECHEIKHTLEGIQWLAQSNYELKFSKSLAVSERIIFPISPRESHGIEDARFVQFKEDNGSIMYYATYTAYNGKDILPMLIETKDFLHFRMLTLNGSAVQNKGMALFPRKIDGQYVMLSRQDDQNILIMFSDNLHYWNETQILKRPSALWEAIKVGNCGSPIETEAGWLVITHGVGPMRKYCIGVILLDLEDPTQVIGESKEPLLSPEGIEREGYVPNVVYSCGSLIHNHNLILPYAMSDKATGIVTASLSSLLKALHSESGK